MRNIILSVLLLLFSTASVQAKRIVEECVYNYLDSHVFDDKEFPICKTGSVFQSLSDRTYYRYEPRSGGYTLLLKYTGGGQVSDDLYVPRGMIIVDVRVSSSNFTIPSQLEYIVGGGADPIVAIDKDAIKESLTSITLESSDQEIVFNYQGEYIETYNLNRPVRFLAPLFGTPNPPKINLPSTCTSWPRGLYFMGSRDLDIPEQITSLPDRCFYNAEGLVSVNLPDGITSIGKECFAKSSICYLNLPYYVSEIGDNAFTGSALVSLTLPWFENTSYLDSKRYKATQWAPAELWKKCSLRVPNCVDSNLGSYQIFSAFNNRFRSGNYYWHCHNGRVKKVATDLGQQLHKPKMETNDVLIVSKNAKIGEGTNVILGQNTDGSTNIFKCQQLIIDEAATHKDGGAFILPIDAYCNKVTFKTQRRGLMETKLPFPIHSDLNGLVAHRDVTMKGVGTRCLPVDVLPALCTTVLLKITDRESIDVVPAAAGDDYVNEEHLVKSIDAMKFETYDSFESVRGHLMGYPHSYGMDLPGIDESGNYDIRNLSELYFFEAYAPVSRGNVNLKTDIYLPTRDGWHTVESFDGKLNGNGHIIGNLNIVEGKDSERLGFIGVLNENGSVDRLSVGGKLEQDIYNNKVYTDAAGLVARNLGHVTGCTINMNVAANAHNAGIVVGSMGRNLSAPTDNLIVGRLKAYQDLGEQGFYGAVYGGWDYSYAEMYDVFYNVDFLYQLADFDNGLHTNYVSNDTYLMIGNSMSSFVNYTSPANYDLLNNLPDCDFYRLFTPKFLQSRTIDQKELNSGAWAKSRARSSSYFHYHQNVSDFMAPLDSIPHPYGEDKTHEFNDRLDSKYYNGVKLASHNCIDYIGAGECGICGYNAKKAYPCVTINTADELRALADDVNASSVEEHDGIVSKRFWNIRLGADIDLGGEPWTPIGHEPDVTYDQLSRHGVRYDGIAFRGIFDGQGHTIKGLKVNSEESNQGLFGVVHDNALICNLRLEGEVTGGRATGAVAGLLSRSEISSVISNVNVQGTSQTGGMVGAMVGAHARLANSVCLGQVAEPEGAVTSQIGRVVGQADVRYEGWDLQPVTIQNVFIPKTESTLYWVGSGTVDGSKITETDPDAFKNDSVNQMMKKEYYFQLLSTAYRLTGTKKLPQLAVELEPVTPEEPVTIEDDNLILVDNYYQISNGAQLRKFAELVNSQKDSRTVLNARLTADIDLACKEKGNWTCMGSTKVPYNGTFEGGGHRISGMIIDDTKAAFSGLFAVTSKASISGIILQGDGITSNGHVGAIVGGAQNNTIIRDCLVDCPVKCTDKQKTAGGVAGFLISNAQVHNCLVLSTVTSSASAEKAGAIVGTCSGSNGKASNCNYLDESNSRAYASTSVAKNFTNCVPCTDDQLRDGATAYVLSQNTSGAAVSLWGQTFGVDNMPTLGGKPVHRTDASYGYDFDYYNVDTVSVNVDGQQEKQLTYTAGNLTLNDQSDNIRLPYDVHQLYAAKVSYQRKTLKGYNSICLPVDIREDQLPDGLILARLALTDTWTSDDKKQTLRFVQADRLPAGTPGLILPKNSDDHSCYDLSLVATAEDNGQQPMHIAYDAQPTDAQGGVKLTGTYQTQPIGEGHYKISNEGSMLLKTIAESHVYPYRWYMTIAETRAALFDACEISLEPDAQAEGQQGKTNRLYDIQGRPVSQTGRQHVIVISNGKKILK